MIEQLQIIKPKRVKESLRAFLLPKHIVLEFGITQVVIPCNTGYPASVIDHKNLFSYEFDSAFQMGNYTEPTLEHKWEEVVINASDTAVFSSYSSSGDDEYFIGSLEIDGNLKARCYGFTYAADYKSTKLRSGKSLSFHVDYQVFYYLFQMFKGLSGKKTDKLLWALSKDKLYLTNESKTFYIICSQDHRSYKYKTKHISSLKTFFEKETKGEKQLLKKEIADSYGSTAKHLIRPFDDVVNVSENDIFFKLRQEGYVLCLTKQKT